MGIGDSVQADVSRLKSLSRDNINEIEVPMNRVVRWITFKDSTPDEHGYWRTRRLKVSAKEIFSGSGDDRLKDLAEVEMER